MCSSWSSRRRCTLYVSRRFDRNLCRPLQPLVHREMHFVRPMDASKPLLLSDSRLLCRWHSHSHSHGMLDDEEETLEQRALRLKLSAKDVKAAHRITWIGVWLNVVLSGLKGVAGVAFHSSGLVADAMHSISDLVSDFVTLVSLRYCARPPDALQPYGYGKYETIGALSVSLLLVGGSLGIITHSFDSLLVLMEPLSMSAIVDQSQGTGLETVDSVAKSVHKHAHGMTMHPAALGMAAVSVVAKEALFRASMNIGQRVHSSVLIANAWHHRSDAVTSIVALSGIGLSLAGFPLFDPLAGIAVGGIILKMGAEMGWDSITELCDVRLSDLTIKSLVNAVDDVVQRSRGEIVGVHQIRSRKVGRHIYVDLTIVVNDAAAVHRAVEWKQTVKNTIKHRIPRVKDIVVELTTPTQLVAVAATEAKTKEDDTTRNHI